MLLVRTEKRAMASSVVPLVILVLFIIGVKFSQPLMNASVRGANLESAWDHAAEEGIDKLFDPTTKTSRPISCDRRGGDSDVKDESASGTTVDHVCRCMFWRDSTTSSASSATPLTTFWHSAMASQAISSSVNRSLDVCYGHEAWQDPIALESVQHWMGSMRHLLHSHRLSKSIRSKPHPFVMERIVQVLLKRISHPSTNPPLRIAVFGGSVTEGFRSRANNLGLPFSQRDTAPCTWARKLEILLNELLPRFLFSALPGGDAVASHDARKIVEVHNFAVSGTDSSIGVSLLEYDFMGKNMAEMDIFVAAFAANDLQAPSGLQRDRIFLHMQNFLRIAKSQRPCNDLPLLLQVADVFEESLTRGVFIRDRLRYSNEMQETANWAGIMSQSYPDAIRDIVYRNISDTTLTEYGQLHPGLSFHTGMAWMIAFGLLDGVFQACDASSLPEHDSLEPRVGTPFPMLHDELRATHIPELWNNATSTHQQQCAQDDGGRRTTSCEYKYIAHRLGSATAADVRKAISRVATNITGWDAYGFPVRKPRRTWKAMQPNASFTLQLDNLSQPINQMSILYLKSYGDNWKSVRLQVTIDIKGNNGSDNNKEETTDMEPSSSWQELQRLELSGFHEANTSISYSEQVNLRNASSTGTHPEVVVPVGGSIRVLFQLLQGAQFQINGLAFCHSTNSIEPN